MKVQTLDGCKLSRTPRNFAITRFDLRAPGEPLLCWIDEDRNYWVYHLRQPRWWQFWERARLDLIEVHESY